jgi:branched-chain amino acid transport system permease protein
VNRLPWLVRDLLMLAIAIAVLIALGYGLERIPINGIAYYNRVLLLIGINISLAVSLNIINGHCGQFSLGHAGFMAVGAYASSFFTVYYFSPIVDRMPEGMQQFAVQNALLLVAILAGGAAAGLAGYIVGLPSLRLRGDYLAIVTLGFGEIIRVVILNVEKIGAARGLSGIPRWANFFWIYFLAFVTIVISYRLVQSSVGRAFLAVREDQIAAEAMGVNTTKYKVKAFVIGSFLAGAAGALFAHFMMYLNPRMFEFLMSFQIVVMVVLGGLGSISGSIVAATLLTALLEVLRDVKNYMPGGKDPRMIMYALLLIILMLTRPQGLLGRRELWQVLRRRKDAVVNASEGPPIQ